MVEKIENSEYGAFVNINNDLGYFIEKNQDCNSLLKMSYGYARRFAVAGMYLQNIVKIEHYEYVMKVFRGFQQLTDGSVKFQEKAFDQAVELIQSYTEVFDRDAIKFVIFSVENGVDSSGLGNEINQFGKIAFVVNSLKHTIKKPNYP